MAMTLTRSNPALLRHNNRHRLVHDAHFNDGAGCGFNPRAPGVTVLLGVLLDLTDHLAPHRLRVTEQRFKRGLLQLQCGEFLLDLDRFKPGELAQPDFKNVFCLAVA